MTVDVRPLDAVAETLGVDKIQLLKIDVEGAEAKVLRGAKALIDGCKVENMIIEWNPEAWEQASELLDRVFEKFEVYEIRPPRPSPLRRIARNALPTERPNLYLRLKGRTR